MAAGFAAMQRFQDLEGMERTVAFRAAFNVEYKKTTCYDNEYLWRIGATKSGFREHFISLGRTDGGTWSAYRQAAKELLPKDKGKGRAKK